MSIEQVAVAPDVITPAGQVIGALAGCVMVLGEAWEIKKLEGMGVPCHMAMWVGDAEGEYMWQVAGSDYDRACKILGGKR